MTNTQFTPNLDLNLQINIENWPATEPEVTYRDFMNVPFGRVDDWVQVFIEGVKDMNPRYTLDASWRETLESLYTGKTDEATIYFYDSSVDNQDDSELNPVSIELSVSIPDSESYAFHNDLYTMRKCALIDAKARSYSSDSNWLVIEGYSDYSGSPLFDKAQTLAIYRDMKEEFPELEGEPDNYQQPAYGDYALIDTAYFGAILVIRRDDASPANQWYEDALEKLEQYPVYDDDYLNEVETESLEETWNSCKRELINDMLELLGYDDSDSLIDDMPAISESDIESLANDLYHSSAGYYGTDQAGIYLDGAKHDAWDVASRIENEALKLLFLRSIKPIQWESVDAETASGILADDLLTYVNPEHVIFAVRCNVRNWYYEPTIYIVGSRKNNFRVCSPFVKMNTAIYLGMSKERVMRDVETELYKGEYTRKPTK